MNKIKNSSMFLLWAGAAISIAEIYTGGLIAPLGLLRGLLAILIGHVIGTAYLAFGGFIAFKQELNAMECVRNSLGSWGVKAVSVLNVLQLLWWSAIMMILGGKALNEVFPSMSVNITILIMAVLVLVWAYFFNNYSKTVNDVSVIALLFLSLALFTKIDFSSAIQINANISFTGAVELSVAMAVSWLPLIGDYTKNAKTKTGSSIFTYLGYFTGSMLMFSLGLFVAIYSGKDIVEFIASSFVGWVACIVIVLSTVTTTFLDVYSAVISTKQIIKITKDNNFIILYSVIALALAYIFPAEKYIDYLYIIGYVFVPIYTVVFIDYFLIRSKLQLKLNFKGVVSALVGAIIYYLLNYHSIGIPSVIVICVVAVIYLVLSKLFKDEIKKHSTCEEGVKKVTFLPVRKV